MSRFRVCNTYITWTSTLFQRRTIFSQAGQRDRSSCLGYGDDACKSLWWDADDQSGITMGIMFISPEAPTIISDNFDNLFRNDPITPGATDILHMDSRPPLLHTSRSHEVWRAHHCALKTIHSLTSTYSFPASRQACQKSSNIFGESK